MKYELLLCPEKQVVCVDVAEGGELWGQLGVCSERSVNGKSKFSIT